MFTICKYRNTRYWAVYDANQILVAVILYKKGAAEIVRRLTQLPESK